MVASTLVCDKMPITSSHAQDTKQHTKEIREVRMENLPDHQSERDTFWVGPSLCPVCLASRVEGNGAVQVEW